jgi:hypothetical protein
MQRACEYFSKVFGHGTVEADTRTIEKKDWTSSTIVRHLVQLITTGSAGVKGLEELLRDLAAAADQVLDKYQLQPPLQSGRSLTYDATQKFLELVPEKFVFSISTSLMNRVDWTSKKLHWWNLWMKGVLLLGSEWETFILAHRRPNSKRQKATPYLLNLSH